MSGDRSGRRRRPPAERIAEIDVAARELALEAGLGAVTLRAVGERLGVAPSLVAHYRPSMDALVADTFSVLASAEFEAVLAACADGRPVDRLRRLVSTLTEPARRPLSAIWADAWSLGRRNEELAGAARLCMADWQRATAELLRDGVRAGAFATDDCDAAADVFFAVVDATAAYDLIGFRSRDAGARLIRTSLEHMLGLAPGTLPG